MAFISFALTKEEFLSGQKTVTRRKWKASHYAMWQRFWDEGKFVHDAWDKVPFAGGKKIGQFELTCRPYHEYLFDMPKDDLIHEGGMVDTLEEFYDLIGAHPNEQVVVIRFKKVESTPSNIACIGLAKSVAS
jgi:hypothetical protein